MFYPIQGDSYGETFLHKSLRQWIFHRIYISNWLLSALCVNWTFYIFPTHLVVIAYIGNNDHPALCNQHIWSCILGIILCLSLFIDLPFNFDVRETCVLKMRKTLYLTCFKKFLALQIIILAPVTYNVDVTIYRTIAT